MYHTRDHKRHDEHARPRCSSQHVQFCKAKPKDGVEEEARIKAEMERKKRANAQITLMDPKTSQNVGIALAKIRLSNEKVRHSKDQRGQGVGGGHRSGLLIRRGCSVYSCLNVARGEQELSFEGSSVGKCM